MTRTRILGASGETILEGTLDPEPVGTPGPPGPQGDPGPTGATGATGASASLDSTPTASGGAAGVGGTAPVDAPAYIVVGFIVKT